MENVVSKWFCTPLVRYFSYLFLGILGINECQVPIIAFIFRILKVLLFVWDLITKIIANFVLPQKSHKNFLNNCTYYKKKMFENSPEKFHRSVWKLLHMFAFVYVTIAEYSFCLSFVYCRWELICWPSWLEHSVSSPCSISCYRVLQGIFLEFQLNFPIFPVLLKKDWFPNTLEISKISYGFDEKEAKIDDFACFTLSHYI